MNKKILQLSSFAHYINKRVRYIPGLAALQALYQCETLVKSHHPSIVEAKREMRRYFRPRESNITTVWARDHSHLIKEWLPTHLTSLETASDWFEMWRCEPYCDHFNGPQMVTTDYKIFKVGDRYVAYHWQDMIW